MGVLWRRLMRSIGETAGQFIAMLTLIALGVGCYYGMNLALDNLERVQAAFYRDTRSADHYFYVQHAPVTLLPQIEAIPGVAQATARIQVDFKVLEDGLPIGIGRLLSLDPDEADPINGLQVVAGPPPSMQSLQADFGIRAYVDSQSFDEQRLRLGSSLEILVQKRQATIIVTGAAASPDYLFKMRDNRQFPDRRDFIVLHISRRNAEKLLDMEGLANQFLIRYSPGANSLFVRERIQTLLEPYGLTASYTQQDQPSVKQVASQIDGLRSSSTLLPTGFFIAAAGIFYIILHRFIGLQQHQIGILRAIGCSTRDVTLHYAAYALVVTLAGTLLGLLAGSLLAADAFATFAGLLSLPANYEPVATSLLALTLTGSILAGLAVSFVSVRRIARLKPAEALRAAAASDEVVQSLPIPPWQQGLVSSWKMTLRSLRRNPGRFAVTATGLTMTVAMLVLAFCYLDSRHDLSRRFFMQENRYDYYVGLDNVYKSGETTFLRNWSGIRSLEPVLEITAEFSPWRPDGATTYPKEGVLLGVMPGSRLLQPFDETKQPLRIPEEGILLDARVAEKLKLSVGNRVQLKTLPVRGIAHQKTFPVVGIARQDMGGGSYISLEAAQQLIREPDTINAILLQTDSPRLLDLPQRLLGIPAVAHVQSKSSWMDIFSQLVGSMTYFTYVMIATAGLLGATIVFLTSLLNFSDRRRELATLRVVGWSLNQVSLLLFNEILLSVVLALLLGCPLGRQAGFSFLTAASNESFTWPHVIYPLTYWLAAGLTLFFALAGHLFAMIRIGKLPLVEVLKNRE